MLLAFFLLAAASPQTPQEAVARVQAAEAEAGRLAVERVAAAARLRTAEAATAAVATRVADLAGRRRAAEARRAQLAAELAPLLPLAERLALYPAETLLAVPLSPEESVRGVIVLHGMAATIAADAAELRARESEIAALQEQLGAEMGRLSAAAAAQGREAGELDARLAAAQATRRAAQDAGEDAARRAAADAARAETLRAALARLEAEQHAAEARAARAALVRPPPAVLTPPATPPPSDGAGLTAPVAGSLARGFGAATDAGPATSVAYQAAPAARVVAPCAGRVAFAGPFRSFGPLLILDCGGATHVVLAGLDRLDAAVGQRVLAGEPVGVMPGWDPRGAARRPLLTLELRRGGEPVDPAPFLRGRS